MFVQAHAGLRHLWPVVFFLPWFFIGLAYLVGSVLHHRARGGSSPEHGRFPR